MDATTGCHNRLEPTAALVMEWAKPLYQDGPAAGFYQCLDLSGGQGLLEQCRQVCPWYGEIILNRKFCITERIIAAALSVQEPCTVIIPAAGKSPMSLVLLDRCGDSIDNIREIDLHSMEEKQRIYKKAASGPARKIHCITGDITAPDFSLVPHDRKPLIVVLEGISYYLTRPALEHLLSTLPLGERRSRVIIEYLIPAGSISPAMRRFPEEVFGLIGEIWGGSTCSRYSPADIAALARSLGGEVTGEYSLHDMETARTGRNQYFRQDSDGWIGVSEIQF